MSNIIIASNPIVTCEYMPDRNVLYQNIHQSVQLHPELFLESLNEGLKAIKKFKICKWLTADNSGDNRPSEILEWIENEWTQQAIEAGWRYRAVVVPGNIKANGALTPVINRFGVPGLRMRVFTNVDDAMCWLDNMPAN